MSDLEYGLSGLLLAAQLVLLCLAYRAWKAATLATWIDRVNDIRMQACAMSDSFAQQGKPSGAAEGVVIQAEVMMAVARKLDLFLVACLAFVRPQSPSPSVRDTIWAMPAGPDRDAVNRLDKKLIWLLFDHLMFHNLIGWAVCLLVSPVVFMVLVGHFVRLVIRRVRGALWYPAECAAALAKQADRFLKRLVALCGPPHSEANLPAVPQARH